MMQQMVNNRYQPNMVSNCVDMGKDNSNGMRVIWTAQIFLSRKEHFCVHSKLTKRERERDEKRRKSEIRSVITTFFIYSLFFFHFFFSINTQFISFDSERLHAIAVWNVTDVSASNKEKNKDTRKKVWCKNSRHLSYSVSNTSVCIVCARRRRAENKKTKNKKIPSEQRKRKKNVTLNSIALGFVAAKFPMYRNTYISFIPVHFLSCPIQSFFQFIAFC